MSEKRDEPYREGVCRRTEEGRNVVQRRVYGRKVVYEEVDGIYVAIGCGVGTRKSRGNRVKQKKDS